MVASLEHVAQVEGRRKGRTRARSLIQNGVRGAISVLSQRSAPIAPRGKSAQPGRGHDHKLVLVKPPHLLESLFAGLASTYSRVMGTSKRNQSTTKRRKKRKKKLEVVSKELREEESKEEESKINASQDSEEPKNFLKQLQRQQKCLMGNSEGDKQIEIDLVFKPRMSKDEMGSVMQNFHAGYGGCGSRYNEQRGRSRLSTRTSVLRKGERRKRRKKSKKKH